jgi:formate dehydrogenase major subunit
MPYHWGSSGLVSGDVVNDLFGIAADPNVFIQECKVATCDIRPGPRPRGRALTDMLAGVRDHAEITPDTGTHVDTTTGSADKAHLEEQR